MPSNMGFERKHLNIARGKKGINNTVADGATPTTLIISSKSFMQFRELCVITQFKNFFKLPEFKGEKKDTRD